MTDTQHKPGSFEAKGMRTGDAIRVSNTLAANGDKCVLIRASGAPFTPDYSADCYLTPSQAGNLAYDLMRRASLLGFVEVADWVCEPSRHPDYANTRSNLFKDGIPIANITWRECLPNERVAYQYLITQAPTLKAENKALKRVLGQIVARLDLEETENPNGHYICAAYRSQAKAVLNQCKGGQD